MPTYSKSFSKSPNIFLDLIVTESNIQPSTNESTINWIVKMRSTNGYSAREYALNSSRVIVNLDGTAIYNQVLSSYTLPANSSITLASGSKVITHNDDGSKSVSISASYNPSIIGSASVSGSIILTKIARYTTVTTTISNVERNSFTINWVAADLVKYWWISVDNGVNWIPVGSISAKSGSTSVGGKTPNTNYNVKVRVQRADNGLITDSATVVARTLANAISNTPTLISKTATQFIIGWSANRTVVNVQYKRWSSDSWQTPFASDFSARSSGQFTINGLTPNITYPIVTRVKDAVTGAWSTDSVALNAETYRLSTVSGANFNLGSNVTATVSEAHSDFYHDISLEYWNGSTWVNGVGATNLPNGGVFTIPQDVITAMENATPNSNTVRCRFKCVSKWGSNGATQGTTYSSEFSATIVNANPTISNCSYDDIYDNQAFIDWKGGPKNIVRNVSILQATIGQANAIKGAKLSKYVATINGKSFTVNANNADNQSNILINCSTVNTSTNTTLVLEAYDTRGNKASTSLPIRILDWYNPQILIASADRENNYEAPTTLNLTGRYFMIKPAGTDVNSFYAQYRVKKQSDSTYGSFVQCTVSKSSTSDGWQEITINQYMQNLDVNTTFDIHLQFKDWITGWRDYYLIVNKGIGLFEYYEDHLEIGVPLQAKTTILNPNFNADLLDGVHADDLVKKIVILAPNTDLNTVIESGFYRLSTGHINAPVENSSNYGQLIVSRGADTIVQVLFPYNDKMFFVRRGDPIELGARGKFSAWEIFNPVSVNNNKYVQSLRFNGSSGTDAVQLLKDNWSSLPLHVPIQGTISVGSEHHFMALKTNDLWGWFEIRSYVYPTYIRRFNMNNGTWQNEVRFNGTQA